METSVYQAANLDIINVMAKILVVDDDVNTTQLINNIFTKEGYEIHPVNLSTNALTEALSVKPDLILLDLMMPDMDGIATLNILKSNPDLAGVPVLVFSASGNIESKVAAFNAGARDFISKPVHLEELKSRVKNWLNHSYR